MGDHYLSFGAGQGAPQRPGGPFAPKAQNPSMDWYQSSSLQFDPGAGYGFGPATAGRGPPAAAEYVGFEDEPPLLEELGIDVGAILRKALAVLTNRLGATDMADLDMGGPLLFALVLGSLHLLTGKLHFGVILGWSVVGSIGVWFVASNLAGRGPASLGGGVAHFAGGEGQAQDGGGLSIYECCCLLWYCMLPLLLHAALCLFLPRGWLQVGAAAAAVLYSGATAARLLARRAVTLEDQYVLVAYPCTLFYAAFSLLNLY